uniref:Uncharacterized protein n=1 Tax=Solanum lycopersicum TaxID=4081 RepID=A0A494GA34_SOLLC
MLINRSGKTILVRAFHHTLPGLLCSDVLAFAPHASLLSHPSHPCLYLGFPFGSGQSSRDRLACQRADIRRLRPTAPRKLDDIGSKVQDDVIQVNDEAKQFLDFVHRVSSTLAKGRKRTDAIESDVNKFQKSALRVRESKRWQVS